MATLVERLRDEADQCRNDGADDIANLLDEAAYALAAGPDPDEVLRLANEMAGGSAAMAGWLSVQGGEVFLANKDRYEVARAALVKLLKGGE